MTSGRLLFRVTGGAGGLRGLGGFAAASTALVTSVPAFVGFCAPPRAFEPFGALLRIEQLLQDLIDEQTDDLPRDHLEDRDLQQRRTEGDSRGRDGLGDLKD